MEKIKTYEELLRNFTALDFEKKMLYENLPKDFFNLKVIHGGVITDILMEMNHFKDKTINLSPDLFLFQVNDERCSRESRVNKINFNDKNQIVDIVIPEYEMWISKPKELLKYIKEKYDDLPQYIMYTDSIDVVILNDILNPKEILDFYQCDILFNCEPNYGGTGPGPIRPHGFYHSLWEEIDMYEKLNEKKYGTLHRRGLNAGVFLGKKDYLIPFLEESVSYMEEDFNKGFPYGCGDDQYMFRWLQNRYFNNVSCDVFNNYFLFANLMSLTSDETHWEHMTNFKRNYENVYLDTYLGKSTGSSKIIK